MTTEKPGILAVWRAFLRVGIYSFNAGASETLLSEIVERRNWLSHADLNSLMAIGALVPGPFHVNLVIAVGNRLAGFAGGCAAALGFVLPGFIIATLMAMAIGQQTVANWLQKNPGVIRGLVVGVAGLLLSAIYRLGQRTLPAQWLWLLVPLLAAALVAFKIPFVAMLTVCGLAGAVYTAFARRWQGR